IGNFQQSLMSRVESLPGVASASLVWGLPPGRPINANTTNIDNATPPPGSRPPGNGGFFDEIDYYNYIGPRYFETVGGHLLEGRLFTASDGNGAPPVAIVNQSMARKYWPSTSAVGQRVRNGPPTAPWTTIVGVVADIKNAGLDQAAGTELYFPSAQ